MLTRHKARNWATAGLASLVCLGAPASSQQLDYVKAEFSVYINNKKAHGDNHLNISHEQNRYRIDFDFEHSLLSVRQEAKFDMQDCEVRPVSYRDLTRPAIGRERHYKLDFDYDRGKASYKGPGKQKEFDLDSRLYDPISLFFEARCELMQGNDAFAYPVIRKGSQKTQHFEVTGKKTIETGQGDVETLVVERRRRNNKRKTLFYVAPDLDYLLIMIEHRESRLMTITARLEHMDYRLTPPDTD